MKRANSEAMNKTKIQLDSVLSKPDYRKYWGVFLLSFFVVIFGVLFDINKASATTWAYKGIAFYAYNNKSTEGTKPVYKFYSSSRKAHFYTISESHKDKLMNNPKKTYAYKGIAFYAYNNKSTEGTKPVYKFYSSSRSTYFYTISKSQKDKLISNPEKRKVWAYKGIAFYAYNNKSTEGTKPVYKFYSSSRSTYFYTISKSQKDKLINGSYGRSIKVGIKLHTPAELRDNSFRIKANKNYVIKNKNGNIISKVSAGTRTRVKYDGNGNLRVYSSIPKTIVNGEVRFEAADGNNLSMIFDVYHAQYRYDGNYYDNYRGKIKLKYSKTYDN